MQKFWPSGASLAPRDRPLNCAFSNDYECLFCFSSCFKMSISAHKYLLDFFYSNHHILNFSGVLYDATGSYTLPFIMAATAFTTSGILCLPMRKLVRWEVRQKNPLRAFFGCEAAEADHTLSQEIDPASMSVLSSEGE